MNLGEFLNFKKNCPHCQHHLPTYFHSKKRQAIKYEDDRLIILFDLNGLKKHQIDYKVGYSFGLNDNSWYVEFFNKDCKRFENDSPDFLRKRFKTLDFNLRQYKFYKSCENCLRYTYSSKYFNLDYRTGLISDMGLHREFIGLSTITEKGFNIYRVDISHLESNSTITYLSGEKDECWAQHTTGLGTTNDIVVPKVLSTDSPQELSEKIKKWILFS